MPRLALVLLCLLLASPLAGQEAARPTDGWLNVNVHESWRGFTACGSRGVGWVKAREVVGPDGVLVAVHEIAHEEWYKRWPSCAAHDAWMSEDRMGRWAEGEAFAYCASARYLAKRDGTSLEAAILHWADLMATAYPFGLTLSQAAAMIRRHCAVP